MSNNGKKKNTTQSEQVQEPTPQPQPTPTPQRQQINQLPGSIPTVQNTYNYLAIGPQGQLYAYDLNLGSWGFATPAHMEQVAMTAGVPKSALEAIKNMRF